MDLTEKEKLLLGEFFPEGILCVDLETTGLSPLVDSIIEIGAIKITPLGLFYFQTFINPEIEIPPHTTLIHHITDKMVQDAPKLTEALNKFKIFAQNLPIVAHNAKFDTGFLVMGMQKSFIPLPTNDIYCSCKLSRQTHPEIKNHKLSTLVAELAIPLLNHHRAMDDAFAAFKIFLSSLGRIQKISSPILRRSGFLFSFAQFEKINAEEFPSHLAPIEKLVKESAVIEIYYTGGSHKNIYRPVKLGSLLNTPDGNILYARCLWSNMQKSFKLKKITAFRLPSANEIQKWLVKNE